MTGAALLALALMTFAVLRYDLPYLLRQGAAMLEARSGMQEISELRESGELDESTRRFFSLVGEIRSYAVGNLGLRNTESYTSYVEFDKDHIVDVVSAVRSDSLRRYEKYYPIVGTVFYRGYFDRRGAERFAARLEERGYDVIIREVDAYSSLGFLADPLYSFMKSYSDYRLAEMIIHEMVHSTLWIPNRNEFNEEIASFIGREGAMDFIRNRRGADAARLEEIRHLRRDYERLVEFFSSLYERLERRYAEYPGPEHEEKRLEIKRQEIEEAKRSFRSRYDELFLTDSYEYVAEMEWNHAFIDLYVQYGGDLSLYYRLLEACGRDIAEATELILSVEEDAEEPREEIRRLLSSSSSQAQ
jgi:predicted aminopeptidase